MARKDFEVRRFEKYGNVYELTPGGYFLENGKKMTQKEVGLEGDGKYWLAKGNLLIGRLQDDFGCVTNCTGTTEPIGTKEIKRPDGLIERITRVVYRRYNGMVCEDKHMIFEADGVTLHDSFVEDAPFEPLKEV